MTIQINLQQASGDQLSEEAAPLAAVQLFANAKYAEFLMAELLGAITVFAQQNIHQIVHPEALAGAVYTGQGFLGRYGGVPGFRWGQAVVAIAAGLVEMVTEISQQCLTAAARTGSRKARSLR